MAEDETTAVFAFTDPLPVSQMRSMPFASRAMPHVCNASRKRKGHAGAWLQENVAALSTQSLQHCRHHLSTHSLSCFDKGPKGPPLITVTLLP